MKKIKKSNVEAPRRPWGLIVMTSVSLLVLFLFCYLVQYPLIIPIFLLMMGFYLHFFQKASVRLFLQLGLLLTLIVFTTYLVVDYFAWSAYYVPVVGVGMLTILLYKDLQLAGIMTLIASVLVTLIVNGNLGMMLIFFLGGLTGAYTVRDARTRGQLLSAGVFIGLIHIFSLYFFYPDVRMYADRTFVLHNLYPLAANGFISVFLVAATLKIFEYLFGVLTNYSLLELSDFNQPLLKRMVLEAPGTYHHSLVVSNLSEAAADAIGANALLTRVGAYYHDIGKMVHPEYFTENQLGGANKHDKIEPSMSRLVILNHVKEGVELAKKYRLNPAIIDFIPQHHGTGLIYFFYQKSLEEADEGEVILEENFRYAGPKPQSRETAITLLADSVEGATRALDEKDPVKIEETVRKIVNNKFIDGQLDECPLTLKEIDKICDVFTRILTAMYHGRVKYPEKKNGNSPRKSAKKDISESAPDRASLPPDTET